MIPPRPSSPPAAWTWPLALGAGSLFALVTALLADGRIGWDLLCWALLSAPLAVVARALWRGRTPP